MSIICHVRKPKLPWQYGLSYVYVHQQMLPKSPDLYDREILDIMHYVKLKTQSLVMIPYSYIRLCCRSEERLVCNRAL